jgi:hypothetical protein
MTLTVIFACYLMDQLKLVGAHFSVFFTKHYEQLNVLVLIVNL